MDITIAICTWNRAASLAAALTACAGLTPPPATSWELLVIDNNSTDDTPQVVAGFRDRLPVRCVFEARQGLSNARNRAIAEAAGEVILWTDDDVLVDADWLVAYAVALRRYPEAAFFGGPIVPHFVVPPPHWLLANLAVFQDALALRNLGAEDRPIAALVDVPNGANMAMRRDALRRHRFDPALGRIGAGLLGGEEIALFERLLGGGLTGYWLGSARVRHVIPPERATLAFIRGYFEGTGRTKMTSASAAERQRLARKRFAWRWRLLGEKLRLRLSRRRDEAWARTFVEVARLEGRIAGLSARPS